MCEDVMQKENLFVSIQSQIDVAQVFGSSSIPAATSELNKERLNPISDGIKN